MMQFRNINVMWSVDIWWPVYIYSVLIVSNLSLSAFADTKLELVGHVETIAGSGGYGVTISTKPIKADRATFIDPVGVTSDELGNIYIADRSMISILNQKTNDIVSFAGIGSASGDIDGEATTVARLNTPRGLVYINGMLFFCDTNTNKIKMVKDGKVVTIAGSSNSGNADGEGTKATFNNPSDIGVDPKDSSVIYIADKSNNIIRKIHLSNYKVETVLNVNKPDSIKFSPSGDFAVIGFSEATSSEKKVMMWYPKTARTKDVGTKLQNRAPAVLVDPDDNIVLCQASGFFINEADKSSGGYKSNEIIVSGTGFKDGYFPSEAPLFSGINFIAQTNDPYRYVFVESVPSYRVRTITIYPRDMPIDMEIFVPAKSHLTNASYMEKYSKAMVLDFTDATKHASDVSYKYGSETSTGTFIKFKVPAYIDNRSTRNVLGETKSWTRVSDVAADFWVIATLKLHLPYKPFEYFVSNLTILKTYKDAFLNDIIDLTDCTHDINVQAEDLTSKPNEVVYTVNVPNWIYNASTNELLANAKYPKLSMQQDKMNRPRDFVISFPLMDKTNSYRQFPTHNATAMQHINRALVNALTGMIMTNVPETDDGSTIVPPKDLRVSGFSVDEKKKEVMFKGFMPGPFENASFTPKEVNKGPSPPSGNGVGDNSYKRVNDAIKEYFSPKAMELLLPAEMIPPHIGESSTAEEKSIYHNKMKDIQAAFLKDLKGLFGLPDGTLDNTDPFQMVSVPTVNPIESTSIPYEKYATYDPKNKIVGFMSMIPGPYHNKSTGEAMQNKPFKPSFPTVISLLEGRTSRNVSFPAVMYPWRIDLPDEYKHEEHIKKLMIEDANDFFKTKMGSHLPITFDPDYFLSDKPPPDTTKITWVMSVPYAYVKTEGDNLTSYTFPKTKAYLQRLSGVSKRVRTEPSFFGGKCNKICVIGIAVMSAALLTIFVVIIVVLKNKKARRKTLVVVPKFDPISGKNPMKVTELGM